MYGGAGGAPDACANQRKRVFTRHHSLTFIHVTHSLTFLSFKNVNCLFNMIFLRWKNHERCLALADDKL